MTTFCSLHYNQQTGCECSNEILNVVHCTKIDGSPTEFSVSVLYRYCMTANKDHTKAVVGACPFNDPRVHYESNYKPIPSNLSDLDKAVCKFKSTGRTGQLCGKCVDGYSPPVYSYYPHCVNCTSGTQLAHILGCVSAAHNCLLPGSSYF